MTRWPAPSLALSRGQKWAAGLLFFLGIALRIWTIGQQPLWSDEAESSINGLGILERGVPTETYLGIPIFENTLVRPWPEHPEYEFRDISYSDRGLAIYHAWLPLYAIAASMRLFGVNPVTGPPDLDARLEEGEVKRLTVVPRLPSVLFAAVFLWSMFVCARRMFGVDAGWAALILASFLYGPAWLTTQARYYAAGIATNALFAWMLTAALQDGRRRYYLGLSAALVLLFHSHLLTFAVACAVAGLALAPLLRRREALGSLTLLSVLVAAGTVPWLLYTGFLGHSSQIPSGWSVVSFPGDLISYLRAQSPYLAVYGLGWALVALSHFHPAVRPRLWGVIRGYGPVFALLQVWVMLGIVFFFAFMPAASFFYQRLSMVLVVPAILLTALWMAGLLRVLTPHFSGIVSALASVAFVLVAGTNAWMPFERTSKSDWLMLRAALQHLKRAEGAKVYATPNAHLVLTYYGGVAVQSIAPVRKRFLDSYAGRMMVFEQRPPAWEADGFSGMAGGAQDLTLGVEMEVSGRAAARIAAAVERPPLDAAVALRIEALIEERRAKVRRGIADGIAGNPLFRGFELEEDHQFWLYFFYRFAGPAERMGERLNFIDRMRGGKATVLPGWVVYEAAPRA